MQCSVHLDGEVLEADAAPDAALGGRIVIVYWVCLGELMSSGDGGVFVSVLWARQAVWGFSKREKEIRTALCNSVLDQESLYILQSKQIVNQVYIKTKNRSKHTKLRDIGMSWHSTMNCACHTLQRVLWVEGPRCKAKRSLTVLNVKGWRWPCSWWKVKRVDLKTFRFSYQFQFPINAHP